MPPSRPPRDAPVDAVLLDLDDTLCAHPRSVQDRLDDAFERAGVAPFLDAADFRRWLPRVEGTSPLDLREQCFSAVARELGRDPDPALAVAAAYEDPEPEDVRFLPGAEAALDALSADHALGLVSNGAPATQRAKLSALGLADRFAATAFGTPERGVKPDPAPFGRALDELATPPERAVHVGNSLRSDVAGAHAAGVRAVHVARADAVVPTSGSGAAPEWTVESMRALAPPPWRRRATGPTNVTGTANGDDDRGQ